MKPSSRRSAIVLWQAPSYPATIWRGSSRCSTSMGSARCIRPPALRVATAQKAVGAAGANRLRAHEALTAIEDGARRAGLVGIPWPGCRHRQAPAPPTAPALYQPQQSGRPPSHDPASAVVRPSHAGRFRFGAYATRPNPARNSEPSPECFASQNIVISYIEVLERDGTTSLRYYNNFMINGDVGD
jgi:hypothetical protein